MYNMKKKVLTNACNRYILVLSKQATSAPYRARRQIMEYRIFIIDQRTYTEHFLGGFNDLWAMRRAVDRLEATIDPACTVEVRSPSGLIVH